MKRVQVTIACSRREGASWDAREDRLLLRLVRDRVLLRKRKGVYRNPGGKRRAWMLVARSLTDRMLCSLQ